MNATPKGNIVILVWEDNVMQLYYISIPMSMPHYPAQGQT